MNERDGASESGRQTPESESREKDQPVTFGGAGAVCGRDRDGPPALRR